MKTKAAILFETGKPLVIDEIEIPPLKPGQVLVDIAYSGVCHTQLLECRGHRGEDKYLPHCLGHEGSGIVREISEGVTKVKPGDKVILSWIKSSGADVPCTIYDWNGCKVNAGGITTFSKQSIISENRLTVINEEISLKEAALIGCAVATGLGAVFNTARPKPGQSLAVFGIGGIGACALIGANLADCYPVIAIDINEEKLNLAKNFGATHVINAVQEDVIKEINHICPTGLDFSIESSGVPEVMIQAINSVRNQGGSAVIVGNISYGKTINLDPHQLNLGKKILGTWGGDNVPDRDFPRYIKLIASGKLKLGPLISKIYKLKEINDVLNDLESGKVLRPLIDMELNID